MVRPSILRPIARRRAALALFAALAASACAGRAARSTPAASSSPITLTYLGVAGWQVDGAGRTILIDPYFSRPDLDRPVASDPAAVAARSPARAELVLVGHTHVDHALDAAPVALRTGAELVGSASTALLAQAQGLPAERMIPIRGGEDYAFDGFSVRVIPALHSALDDKHTLGRVMGAPPTLPVPWRELPEGGTFAYLIRLGGHQIFVLGSANFLERELQGLRPDIAIVGVGLRHEIHDYTCRLLHALGDPPTVITNHFDDWTAPATDEPPGDDLRAFVAEVEACAPGTRVIIPRHFAPMTLR